MNDPADLLDELQRLRDLAKRLLDPRDLGRRASHEIRRAAAIALHGRERAPHPSSKEQPR